MFFIRPFLSIFRSWITPVLLSIVLLVVFNTKTLNLTPVTQLRYEHWFRQVGQRLLAVEDEALGSKIIFKASSDLPQFSGVWELDVTSEKKNLNARRLLHRLLELAQEAKIFRHELKPEDKHVQIIIQGEGREFQSFLSESDVSTSIATQTLLQLIVIYDSEINGEEENENT